MHCPHLLVCASLCKPSTVDGTKSAHGATAARLTGKVVLVSGCFRKDTLVHNPRVRAETAESCPCLREGLRACSVSARHLVAKTKVLYRRRSLTGSWMNGLCCVAFGCESQTCWPGDAGAGDSLHTRTPPGVGRWYRGSWRQSEVGPPCSPPSLPPAVQDVPPVVRPGLQPPLGRAGGDVLVVAGGEQDVLPWRIGLHSW